MNSLKRPLLCGCLLLLILPGLSRGDSPPPANAKKPVRILLMGDSTCIGSICRIVAPKADHLEQIMEKLLAAEADLPPVEVINQGRDGEWIGRLFSTGLYDRKVATLKDLDFILMRYGANDRARLKDFKTEFPRDYRQLFERLRKDHPHATLVLMTMLPFFGEERNNEVNDVVRSLAAEQKLPLCDTCTRYSAELKFGRDMLNYRRLPLDKIPEKLRPLAADCVLKDKTVVVLDNRLDAHFRNVPGWFRDRHPNLAGYHVIGDETAKFLAPLIQARQAGK